MSRLPPSILVAGAINTDLVATMERAPAAGETITGSGFAIHGGGKAANQAVAAARSGASVWLVGAVGDDDFGRARLADLEADNVRVEWVRVASDAPSGVALILVERGGENRIAYVPGATLTVPAKHGQEAVEALSPPILLATNELPPDTLSAMMAHVAVGGGTVIFNATPEPGTAKGLLAYATMLIVNSVEAAALLETQHPGDAPQAAEQLRAAFGIETVIITAGKDGAYFSGPSGANHIPAPEVDVVDTTGAGDTFCGAFAAALADGRSIGEAVDYGVRASAISVTRAGAQSSIPTRREVEGR